MKHIARIIIALLLLVALTGLVMADLPVYSGGGIPSKGLSSDPKVVTEPSAVPNCAAPDATKKIPACAPAPVSASDSAKAAAASPTPIVPDSSTPDISGSDIIIVCAPPSAPPSNGESIIAQLKLLNATLIAKQGTDQAAIQKALGALTKTKKADEVKQMSQRIVLSFEPKMVSSVFTSDGKSAVSPFTDFRVHFIEAKQSDELGWVFILAVSSDKSLTCEGPGGMTAQIFNQMSSGYESVLAKLAQAGSNKQLIILDGISPDNVYNCTLDGKPVKLNYFSSGFTDKNPTNCRISIESADYLPNECKGKLLTLPRTASTGTLDCKTLPFFTSETFSSEATNYVKETTPIVTNKLKSWGATALDYGEKAWNTTKSTISNLVTKLRSNSSSASK